MKRCLIDNFRVRRFMVKQGCMVIQTLKTKQFLKRNHIQGGPKKSLWCDVEEKCLRNSKIFFDGVFLSIYSHLVKKLKLSKSCRKKVIGL
jgi:hypothetical protein